MGGCTNSKHADVDEGKQPKEKKKLQLFSKKSKKENGEAHSNGGTVDGVDGKKAAVENGDVPPKAEKEDIEFIDKEEAERAAKAAAANSSFSETKTTTEDENAKKEVTTYQTTVVKHTQREGDELLQHLKDEAFRTLQTLLNEESKPDATEQEKNIVDQIKEQVVASVGKAHQDQINSIIDSGASLIKENKVQTMAELNDQLVAAYPDVVDETKTEGGAEVLQNSQLITKVINATTGFLTAKGTEAGALLSNILANVHSGIQGVMNETEKTTVKVTRTVTEQVMTSGGEIKETTRVITSDEPSAAAATNIEDVLKNLSGSDILNKVTKTGTTTSSFNQVTSEKHESVAQENSTTNESITTKTEETSEGGLAKQQAEQVVTKVVSAAVEKIIDETNQASSNAVVSSATTETSTSHVNGHNGTNGFHHEEGVHENGLTEEHIKIEEEKSVRTSTTKIVLNNDSTTTTTTNNEDLDHVQQEFYKQGKQAAEDVVKKVTSTSELNTNSEASA